MALRILAHIFDTKLDRIQKISCYSVVELEAWVFTYVLSRGIFYERWKIEFGMDEAKPENDDNKVSRRFI